MKNKITEIKCKHAGKDKDESIYIYNIGDNQQIALCPVCNMNLAGEICKQMALEAFLKK